MRQCKIGRLQHIEFDQNNVISFLAAQKILLTNYFMVRFINENYKHAKLSLDLSER